jgi:hypothetical protein
VFREWLKINGKHFNLLELKQPWMVGTTTVAYLLYLVATAINLVNVPVQIWHTADFVT